MKQLDLPQVTANTFPGLPTWLAALKLAALSRFQELGYPTRDDEEWRFTDIRPIVSTAFTSPAQTTIEISQLADLALSGTHHILIVDGVVKQSAPSDSRIVNGLKISNLAQALGEDAISLPLGRYAGFERNVFTAQNTANFEDCLVIQISRNAVIEEPLHIIYVSTARDFPTISFPRTLVIAGESSQVTLIETWVTLGEAVTFANSVTEFILAENANVDHYKVNQTANGSFHISTTQIQQASSSSFCSNSFILSGQIVRNDINAVHAGEGISSTLNGLSLADGIRIIDNHTSIDHATPNCESHELYKYILDDKSKGVFNGKIFVREDAQKTDAKQTNKTLLLSDDAQIDTKPQLEIYADDVKCTHGATIGQLDDKQLFYLRSRGISLEDAKSLLVYAFAGELINKVKVDLLKERLDAHLLSKLPQK